MKAVTKYVSDDGREFLSEPDCMRYEALCKEVAEIMGALAPRPDLPGCGFENGDGYLQHDPAKARAARGALLKIANTIFPHKWFEQSMADATAHASWAGRLIDEMDATCLRSAWHRFMCMTTDFREYGQPFYATNPREAKDVCLNERAA